MTKVVNDPRKPYSYTVLEYAALWLNDKHHSRPDSTGTMVEGAMAKGELTPGNYRSNWTWVPRIRDNNILSLRKTAVKNTFIHIEMKGRKFSVFPPKPRINLLVPQMTTA